MSFLRNLRDNTLSRTRNVKNSFTNRNSNNNKTNNNNNSKKVEINKNPSQPKKQKHDKLIRSETFTKSDYRPIVVMRRDTFTKSDNQNGRPVSVSRRDTFIIKDDDEDDNREYVDRDDDVYVTTRRTTTTTNTTLTRPQDRRLQERGNVNYNTFTLQQPSSSPITYRRNNNNNDLENNNNANYNTFTKKRPSPVRSRLDMDNVYRSHSHSHHHHEDKPDSSDSAKTTPSVRLDGGAGGGGGSSTLQRTKKDNKSTLKQRTNKTNMNVENENSRNNTFTKPKKGLENLIRKFERTLLRSDRSLSPSKHPRTEQRRRYRDIGIECKLDEELKREPPRANLKSTSVLKSNPNNQGEKKGIIRGRPLQRLAADYNNASVTGTGNQRSNLSPIRVEFTSSTPKYNVGGNKPIGIANPYQQYRKPLAVPDKRSPSPNPYQYQPVRKSVIMESRSSSPMKYMSPPTQQRRNDDSTYENFRILEGISLNQLNHPRHYNDHNNNAKPLGSHFSSRNRREHESSLPRYNFGTISSNAKHPEKLRNLPSTNLIHSPSASPMRSARRTNSHGYDDDDSHRLDDRNNKKYGGGADAAGEAEYDIYRETYNPYKQSFFIPIWIWCDAEERLNEWEIYYLNKKLINKI